VHGIWENGNLVREIKSDDDQVIKPRNENIDLEERVTVSKSKTKLINTPPTIGKTRRRNRSASSSKKRKQYSLDRDFRSVRDHKMEKMKLKLRNLKKNKILL
jgi:hypothetical protein